MKERKHHYVWDWEISVWVDAWGYGWEFERFGRNPGWARTTYTRRN